MSQDVPLEAAPDTGPSVAPAGDAHERAALREGVLWSPQTILTAVRVFALATILAFVVGTTVGVCVPGFEARVWQVISNICFLPTDWLAQLLPSYFVILLNNMRASLISVALGGLGALVLARLNGRAKPSTAEGPPGALTRALERGSGAVAAVCIWAGSLVFPHLRDARREFPVRSAAGLAAIVPTISLFGNGTLLGLYLALGLLGGWTHGLLTSGEDLFPHGFLEFPAILLSGALGLGIARRLIPSLPEHGCSWQERLARACLTSDAFAKSYGIILCLIAVAAALEVGKLV